MTDRLFLIDIHEDSIAALTVDNSSKVTRVTGCGEVDILSQSFDAAIGQLMEQTGFTSGTCLVTFGTELFSFRNVTLPFSDKKKIEQALPFELVDYSPVDISGQLIDFVVAKSSSKGADVVAAMIDRDFLGGCLAALEVAGLSPESIGLSGHAMALKIGAGLADNFVLVDLGSHWASLFIAVDGRVALVRSLPVQPEVEGRSLADDVLIQNVTQTVLAARLLDTQNPNYKVYMTGSESRIRLAAPDLSTRLGVDIDYYRQSDQPLIKVEPEIQGRYQPDSMGRILANAFKNDKKSGSFNFRKDDFRKKKSLEDYRDLGLKVALPLVVLLLSGLVYLGFGYSQLKTEQENLRVEIQEVFKETLPGVKRIVNPVQQLQVANNQIRTTYRPGGGGGASYTLIELLTELSAQIPSRYDVKVVRMVADTNTIRLKAVTGDFNTVDSVQKELGKSSYFKEVTISSANQSIQGDEVNFELKLELVR